MGILSDIDANIQKKKQEWRSSQANRKELDLLEDRVYRESLAKKRISLAHERGKARADQVIMRERTRKPLAVHLLETGKSLSKRAGEDKWFSSSHSETDNTSGLGMMSIMNKHRKKR